MAHSETPGIRVIGSEEVLAEAWLTFKHKHFVDRAGTPKCWSYVERTGGQQAVVVIARTRETGRLILVRQFRVPLEAWVYEFPAGLVDAGETVEATAHRELAEETGYFGVIERVGPAVPGSPGLSSETMHVVTMRAEEAPRESEHEPAEAIEVVVISTNPESVGGLLRQAEREGSFVDAKLYTWLQHYL